MRAQGDAIAHSAGQSNHSARETPVARDSISRQTAAQVLETPSVAVGHPDSAALSRPDFVTVAGGMRMSVRRAARLQTYFQHPAHPLPVKRPRRVDQPTL